MDRPRAERDTIINFATRSATRPISAVPIKHHFRREIPVCKFLHTVRQPVVMVAHVIDRRVMVPPPPESFNLFIYFNLLNKRWHVLAIVSPPRKK